MPPLHGYQGDRGVTPPPEPRPSALTLAVSREAGARGGTIARRAAWKLGWQVYNQELLEHIAQEASFLDEVQGRLPEHATRWADEQMQRLLRENQLAEHPSLLNLARVVLSLGASGEVVLLGRGAGYMLPRATTLHVRVVADLQDRVAYMSEWLRLTPGEAAEQVNLRDRRRDEFILTHFNRQPADAHHYDLVLNSSLLGEETCAELIARAATAKQGLLQTDGEELPCA